MESLNKIYTTPSGNEYSNEDVEQIVINRCFDLCEPEDLDFWHRVYDRWQLKHDN